MRCADWLHSIKTCLCSWRRVGSLEVAWGKDEHSNKMWNMSPKGRRNGCQKAHNGEHPIPWVTCNKVLSAYLSEKQKSVSLCTSIKTFQARSLPASRTLAGPSGVPPVLVERSDKERKKQESQLSICLL